MIEQVRIFLLPVLKIFSSPEHQQRVWVEKTGPEMDSYIECIDEFLEISEAILNNKDMQEGISPSALSMLKQLSDDIKAFHKTIKGWDAQNVLLILADPKWGAIQSRSQELFSILNQL